jgi:tetratricopeptide (TPR) repeat protein
LRKILPLLLPLLLAGCVQPKGTAGYQPAPDRQADAFSTYLSARFAAGEHDMNQAARYYGLSLKNDPSDSALLALAFFYATASGDVDNAGKLAVQIAAKNSDDREARLALAVVAFKHKDYAEARKQLSLSAKGPFTVLTVSLFDGWAAAANGDAAGAAKDMQTLAAQSGAEGMGAFHAALIADFLKQPDAAEAFYKKALTINAASPRAIEAYGNFLERVGRTAEAASLYQKIAGSAALAPVAQPGLARIAAGKKPDPMVRSAEDGAAEALFGIAASLTDPGSAEYSILYLRMALYLRPDLALAQILLASRFESLRKYEDAVAAYDQIDKSSPYYRMAAVEAAVNRTRLNRKNDAIRDLRALAEASADDSETWIALGDTYRDADNYDGAIDAYTKAEKAIGTPQKRDWPLFYARAMAEDKLHHWDKSEADLNLALKLSPEQPELLNYLGYSWVDQGKRIPEALTMLEKARSLRPYDGYIVDSVGWAYYRLGRYDDAAKTLEAAVLLVPGDSTINDHFGDALWKAGRRMEARFQWNHALAFSEDDGEKASIEQKLKSGLTG